MLEKTLKLLEPAARSFITENFCNEDGATINLANYAKAFSRTINLEPFQRVIEKATDRFHTTPEKSDGWLAPRVHAALRLTRREAADKRVWDYLTVVVVPEYVRWRWKTEKGVQATRFIGPEYKQAVARLWWGAELTRNGEDYRYTPVLFANQDLQNSWARLDLFHHRAVAIASLKFLQTFRQGRFASSDDIRQLAQGFNMSLSTTMLDAITENPAIDDKTIMDWAKEPIDETLWDHEEPKGPMDTPVDDVSIEEMTRFLGHVVQKIAFFKRSRKAGLPDLEE